MLLMMEIDQWYSDCFLTIVVKMFKMILKNTCSVRKDFICHSFCSFVTNWCFIDNEKRKINKKTNKNNISFSLSGRKSQLFAFTLRLRHSLLLLVMSRSIQVIVSSSSSSLIRQCVCVCANACEMISIFVIHRTHRRYSVSTVGKKQWETEKKRSSFHVCRWEIIGFVKRTTQTETSTEHTDERWWRKRDDEEIMTQREKKKKKRKMKMKRNYSNENFNVKKNWFEDKYQGLR